MKCHSTVRNLFNICFVLVLVQSWALFPAAHALDVTPRDHGFFFWENGSPSQNARLMSRRPLPRTSMEANPVMAFQTGYYALRMSGTSPSLLSLGAYAGSDYESELLRVPGTLPPARLSLGATIGGTAFACTQAMLRTAASNGLAVRIIEAGRFLNRIDHIGLVFKDAAQNSLYVTGSGLGNPRVEFASWPDRLAVTLDFSTTGIPSVSNVGLGITSGTHTLACHGSTSATLTIEPCTETAIPDIVPSDYVFGAVTLVNGTASGAAVPVTYDRRLAALRFDIPAMSGSDRLPNPQLDEIAFTLTNHGAAPVALPLVFQKTGSMSITGITAVLCNSDGTPSGIPVQHSKDWHQTASEPLVSKQWFRACAFVRLAPGESVPLRLRIAYSYWGNVAAVSQSQLSLVGYGGNSLWNQSALGSWGETICFDPDQLLGDSFITDYRPTFVTSISGGTQNWTANEGGAQFLAYYNNQGVWQYPKCVKTAYLWPGPCLSRTVYTGVTEDEKLRFTYTVGMPRSNDFSRQIFRSGTMF